MYNFLLAVGANLFDVKHILGALVYSLMGILIFIVVFALVDWISPKKIWEEIADKQNTAMAILAGFVALGMCIIIAAAMIG